MITGSTYLLRGVPVRVVAGFNAAGNPELPRLQAALPWVRLNAHGPRNVLIERPDGSIDVRPFRGLRKPPAPVPAWTQPALGDCGDGYGTPPPARTVHTLTVTGGVL